MSSSNCCFLTSIQISQEAGQVVWYSHLFQNVPLFVVFHTVKGFGIGNKEEIGVLFCFVFWNSLAFSMIQQMLAIWSLVPLPFLKAPWASGSSRFTCGWSLAWRIQSITLLACEMSAIVWYILWECMNILWHCLSLGLEWKLTFSSPVATAEISKFYGILSVALSQHYLSGFEIAQLECHHFRSLCS